MSKEIGSVTVGIAVEDVTEAAKWYRQLLGDVETMEPAPGTLELKLTENTWLQLDDTGYLEMGGGSAIIRFETQDIQSTHEAVRTLAPDADDIVTVEGVIKYFDFKEPAGNRLSFYELI